MPDDRPESRLAQLPSLGQGDDRVRFVVIRRYRLERDRRPAGWAVEKDEHGRDAHR